MTEVPKIVYDRLRAALPEHALPLRTGPELAHPDANLLTAFAEQTLSPTEREGMLAHLALCGDCRDVIALALPAADIVAAPMPAEGEAVRTVPTKTERNWLTATKFAWPSLRWAALAAGIAVVASVLLLRPGKLNQAIPPSVNPQVAITAPSASGPQIASSAVPSSPTASSPTEQSALSSKAEEPQAKSELRLSKKLKAGQTVTPSHQTEHGMLLAENKKDAGPAAMLSPAPAAGAPAFDAAASRGATETVEVSAGAAAVKATPSTESSLMAQNETQPVIKSKPALQGVEVAGVEVTDQQATVAAAVVPAPAMSPSKHITSNARLAAPASSTIAHNITWTIAAGELQRSMDSGRSWQNTLHADHPLLCYASHDNDVWTGGQAGTLFHSADSGVTWVQVRPSIKGQQLSFDVTHIDVRGPAEIVVSTSNHEIWSSADGGRTWDKK
jgi:hypothetical protein